MSPQIVSGCRRAPAALDITAAEPRDHPNLGVYTIAKAMLHEGVF
jgi:hypothetical protein